MNFEKKYNDLVARLNLLVSWAAPPNQCLYGDDGVDCMSHCDCSWGDIWYKNVQDAINEVSLDTTYDDQID